MVFVQLAFITTVLYWGPVMHGVWKSPGLFLVHVVCYAALAWGGASVICTIAWGVLSALWAYVTLVTVYFMDESASLQALAQPVVQSVELEGNVFRF